MMFFFSHVVESQESFDIALFESIGFSHDNIVLQKVCLTSELNSMRSVKYNPSSVSPLEEFRVVFLDELLNHLTQWTILSRFFQALSLPPYKLSHP